MSLLTRKNTRRNGRQAVGGVRRAQKRLGFETLEDRRVLSLLGVSPGYPAITYNSTGTTTYQAATQAFDVKATPVFFRESAASPIRTLQGVRTMEIHIRVDNTGHLVGGVPGNDLLVTGSVDINGDGTIDVSGTLLTGEIREFGFLNVTTTDSYDFRFKPTGGALASYYAGKDIGLTTSSENSTFVGSFTQNFGGGAKGSLGPIKAKDLIVISPDKDNGSVPYIKLMDPQTGAIESQFLAYDAPYRGGVRVATGDLDGDGIAEIVTAPGRNHAPLVRVFDQQGNKKAEFMAFSTSFLGGVELGIGDVDGDGKNDIAAAMSYQGSQVTVFRNTSTGASVKFTTYKTAFYPFGSSFKGGAVVEIADMGTFSNGKLVNANVLDGKAEIVVGNESGMRSTVLVFDYSGTTAKSVRTFYPFNATFRGGLSLDVARVNSDVIPDIIVGSGNSGGSKVAVLDGLTGAVLQSFVAFPSSLTSSYNAPVRVAGQDLNGDGVIDLIYATQGTDGTSRQVRSFSALTGKLVQSISATDATFCAANFVTSLRTRRP